MSEANNGTWKRPLAIGGGSDEKMMLGGGHDVPQEWRHFRPRGKVFILKAIRASESAKDMGATLEHYVGIGGYMQQGC